jgi:hypothetical protein
MRLVVLAAASLVLLGGGIASAGPPPTPPGATVVSADQGAATARSMGISVPAQSCLGNPRHDGCPAFDWVVIQPPSADQATGARGYGPLVTSRARRFVSTGRAYRPQAALTDQCAVIAHDPALYTTVTGYFENQCLNYYGISDLELWGDITRWNATDQRWYTLNECYTQRHSSPWYQTCRTSYDCYHPYTLRKYRNVAQGFVIINGTGYLGVDYSNTKTDYCY